MASFNLLVLVCLGYVALLFVVAFIAERFAAAGRDQWLRSPLIYTLSLSIYCTAWTFYGAVGYAARSGLEFITIYLGPTLVMIGWWWGVRKLVRIGRSQRVTSVADLISSRYGKSNALGVLITVLCVVAITPYISLQLQSITLSFEAFAEDRDSLNSTTTAFWAAAGLAIFAILFGTRNLDANERHPGVVTAVAVEAVVKLVALLAVGIFVVWGLAGGVGDILARIDASEIGQWQTDSARWTTILFLAAAAFICLPRMFQVMIVENPDERYLETAGWAFPLYLAAMSLFVVPIAVMGLGMLPTGANPDLFVLTLPLSADRDGLAVFAFLGGFSSATSMVIVAAMALSTMVSNHIVMPLWLSLGEEGASASGDVRKIALCSRRLAIAGIMALGYIYFQVSGGGAALAAIGLIAFSGIAQILPALLGGLYWRGATRAGAASGVIVGFVVWAYTLLLPETGSGILTENVLLNGPAGIGWLRPGALFGIEASDPIVHAVAWSLLLNSGVFCLVSLVTFPTPMEQLQGAQFVNVFDHSPAPRGWSGSHAQTEDLMVMLQRIMGAAQAQAVFRQGAQQQGIQDGLPDPTPGFLEFVERELSGSVGAAAAHAMIAQIVGQSSVSVEDLLAVAGESAELMEYSSRLEAQSAELSRTARQLRDANLQLTMISEQKDAFLSQVSHELRTPMTSIRAFSELISEAEGLTEEEQARFGRIINDEAQRLTRLLDDLLDLSVLESGKVQLNLEHGNLADALDQAVSTVLAGQDAPIRVLRARQDEAIDICTDLDRLTQVFINILSNAQKYCDAKDPRVAITVSRSDGKVMVDFVDNGSGVAVAARQEIFEKFARAGSEQARGTGLGLAICREILQRLGGEMTYLDGIEGGAFRVRLPTGTRA